MHRARFALALLAGLAPATAAAQEFLDRGTFVITMGGAETAREEFAVRSTAARGLQIVSTTRGGGRETQHALEVTGEYVPVSFQQTESAGGQVVRRVSAQLAGTRFNARISSADGETAREFPVRPPVLILGDQQASAFYFAPRPEEGGSRTLAVVRPDTPRAITATVEAQGQDTVTVGGRPLTARRYVLRAADGDERRFWFTAEGSLVRVVHAGQGSVATRAELPAR